ncbi:hypothetical protein NKG05_12805 [Oerskovia sp. M15]
MHATAVLLRSVHAARAGPQRARAVRAVHVGPVVNNLVSIVGFVLFIMVYGPYATGAVENLGTWDGTKIALLAGTATSVSPPRR